MIKNRIESEKINRFFKGEYSEEDRSNLNEVFCDRDKEKELEKHLRRQWYELLSDSDFKEEQLDHILYRIHYEVNTKLQKSERTLLTFVKWFSRVAAILILPLLIYSGIHFYRSANKENTSWVEIKAAAWTRAQFSLPDGTTGWLNSNSSIKYDGRFNNNRQVTLNGEAFFDVYQDSKRPFKVSADEILVTVFGTRFNIASYDNENTVEVVLEEGRLLFNNKEMNKSYSMQPNDCIIYNKKLNDFTIEIVQPEKYYSWTNGKLVFRNDSLDVIARRLERWYNIEVEIRGNISNQPRLWATFVDENLEEVLRLLKLSLPIYYDIEHPQVQTDGVYSKTKVTITSKIN